MNRIAVGIMVKNESKVIERCLSSILRLEPDMVIITDTGSTDDTVAKAGLFLQKQNLKFKIFHETFVDFAHNRSLVLDYCRKEAQIDYIVMVDADDLIEYHDDYSVEKFRASLTADIYYMRYQDGLISYSLPKITSNKIPLKYVGVTHEFLDCQSYSIDSTKYIFTSQRGDSFRRVNNLKNTNDIELLRKALEGHLDEGLRARYIFYLAQAYYAAGDKNSALFAYQTRTELKGWDEEVFYSHYQLGNIHKEMGTIDGAIKHYLAAYHTCPHRVESLVNLKYLLDSLGEKAWADHIFFIAKQIKHPQKGLFIEDYKYYAFR